jgi:hypothetical protein
VELSLAPAGARCTIEIPLTPVADAAAVA